MATEDNFDPPSPQQLNVLHYEKEPIRAFQKGEIGDCDFSVFYEAVLPFYGEVFIKVSSIHNQMAAISAEISNLMFNNGGFAFVLPALIVVKDESHAYYIYPKYEKLMDYCMRTITHTSFDKCPMINKMLIEGINILNFLKNLTMLEIQNARIEISNFVVFKGRLVLAEFGSVTISEFGSLLISPNIPQSMGLFSQYARVVEDFFNCCNGVSHVRLPQMPLELKYFVYHLGNLNISSTRDAFLNYPYFASATQKNNLISLAYRAFIKYTIANSSVFQSPTISAINTLNMTRIRHHVTSLGVLLPTVFPTNNFKSKTIATTPKFFWGHRITCQELDNVFHHLSSTTYGESPFEFMRFWDNCDKHLALNSHLQIEEELFDEMNKIWPGLVYAVYGLVNDMDLLKELDT